jgi:intermediate peptidase
VYIDMFRRPHKFPGAAHFTVRCGCDTVEYEYGSHEAGMVSPFAASSYDTTKWRPKAQTPIVALVFPFHPPSSDAASQVRGMSFTAGHNATALANHCLSLSDVETLFHEWGHALHSLLSKAKYQHHSGTRGFTDFVEIPSHLFEHFARDPQVIRQWAKHHVTGESIPLPLLETALSGKANYQGLDLQVQIALSLADQYLLSNPTLTTALSNPSVLHSDRDQRRFFLQAMEGIAALQLQYTDLPVAALSSVTALNGPAASQQWLQSALDHPADAAAFRLPYMPMLAHRHFVGYAGTYHSYLYAKVVAAQIWDRLFVSRSTSSSATADNVLSREMGLHLRRELLAKGSSRPADLLLSRLLHTSQSKGEGSGESRSFAVDPEPYLRMMMRGLA